MLGILKLGARGGLCPVGAAAKALATGQRADRGCSLPGSAGGCAEDVKLGDLWFEPLQPS